MKILHNVDPDVGISIRVKSYGAVRTHVGEDDWILVGDHIDDNTGINVWNNVGWNIRAITIAHFEYASFTESQLQAAYRVMEESP
jgi:hypothetical protein